MEEDEYIPGNIFFEDLHSLRTTNGIAVSTVAGSSTNSHGYNNSAGTNGRFFYIYGIYQKNRTHVTVADYGNACLRMIDRTNGQI